MSVVVLADASPLFSLAAGDLLDILLRFPLLVTDVVKEETFDKGLLPGCTEEARRLLDFYNRHAAHIQVAQTQVGHEIRTSRKTIPNYCQPRNLGELSIQSHLIQLYAQQSSLDPLVLFEDSWFYEHQAALPHFGTLISTEAFLLNAERLKIIRSAKKARDAINTARPNASAIFFMRNLSQSR